MTGRGVTLLIAPLAVMGCGRSALDALGLDAIGTGGSAVDDGGVGTGLDAARADATSGTGTIGPDDGGPNADDAATDGAGLGDGCSGPPCRKATAVAIGLSHACALMSDGTVECWGQNDYGQLGNPTGVVCSGSTCDEPPNPLVPLEASVPVIYPPSTVPGLTGVTAITAGDSHTCAVRSDGTVRCWGRNSRGQLGNATTAATYLPTQVTGLANAAGVTASWSYTCAWRTDGSVACWGVDQSGELGSNVAATCPDNVWACSTTPVAVPGVTSAKAVAAGEDFACALLADETLTCWGGTEDSITAEAPSTLPGVTRATAVVASLGAQACAVLEDTTAACWGDNAAGQLGRGPLDGSFPWGWTPTPGPVEGLSGVLAMAAGREFTCAQLAGGTVDCWGYDGDGSLGHVGGTELTAVRGPSITGVVALSAGAALACAILGDGSVQCWGNGDATPRVVPL